MSGEAKFPRVNSLFLSARLTKDVELKYVPSGLAVAKISVAFDKSFQKNGEWVNETSFIDLVLWNKKAEKAAETLHKGSPVLIEGSLQIRYYVDKDNNKRSSAEINVFKLHALEKPGDNRGMEDDAPY